MEGRSGRQGGKEGVPENMATNTGTAVLKRETRTKIDGSLPHACGRRPKPCRRNKRRVEASKGACWDDCIRIPGQSSDRIRLREVDGQIRMLVAQVNLQEV